MQTKQKSMKHKISIAAIIAACSFSAIAAPSCVGAKVSDTLQSYFVSGVLKKNEGAITIKLVHATERASSEQEALVIFVKRVRAEYPNYTMADALISPATSGAETACKSTEIGVSI